MIEVSLGISRERARELKEARFTHGAIEVSISALIVAYNYTVEKKDAAIDAQEFEEAATWRDNEKNILHGIADMGLVPVESDAPSAYVTARIT